MYSTVAIAAVAMCWLLPVSVDAIDLQLRVDFRKPGEENNVKLQCDGTVAAMPATFYRTDSAGSEEEQLNNATVMNYNEDNLIAVTFVLDGATEGLYFCRSGGDVSPKRKLVGK